MTKKLSILVALGFLALGTISCQKLKARDNLNKGVQAFRAQKYDAAIDHFKSAIELDPELTNAELYLATAYAQQFVPGSPDEANQKVAQAAIQTFDKVLEKDPSNKTAIAGKASIYQNNSEYDKAREAYMKNAEVDPQNHIPFYAVGSMDWKIVHNTDSKLSEEERSKLIEEGLQYLDKAMAINPDYEDSLWYENLLLREKAYIAKDKAKLTKDKNEQKQLLAMETELNAKADDWSNRAMEVRKKNAEKASSGGGIHVDQ
jgi:tetratricopeptide (TPR) repeat protein